MKEAPALEMLNQIIVTDTSRDIPLHAQVRRALKVVIDDHFDDGQQFWTETALIEQLGISQITVRRALQDLSREGVLERRRAVGSFVRKEKKGPVSSVGVFIPAWDSTFTAGMLAHWSRLLQISKRKFHIYYTHGSDTTADAYAQLQSTPQNEGIILFGNSPQATRELYKALHDREFRVVAVDSWVRDLKVPYLGVDNALGIRMSLEHLTGLGHRRIALLVNEPQDIESVVERIRAFRQITKEMNIDSRILECGITTTGKPLASMIRTNNESLLNELWASNWRPTAFMAVSDLGAWALLRWCAQQGISVPGQVSVMGFDDDRPSKYMNPALTTTAQPQEAMARRALEILDTGLENVHELLPPNLVLRESTAPPPTS
jgi:LacI family transcriptional regulator